MNKIPSVADYATSGGFDLVVEHVSAYRRLHELVAEAVIANLPEKRTGGVFSVLEMGCGPGYGLHAIQERAALEHVNVNLSGVEYQEGNVLSAQKRVPDAHIIQGDAHHTRFPDEAFDGVVITNMLYLTNVKEVLREVRRLLVPGGAVVISEPLDTADMMKILFGEISLRWQESGIRGVIRLGRSLIRSGRAVASALRYNSRVTSGSGVTKFSEREWKMQVEAAGLVVDRSMLVYHNQNTFIVAHSPRV